MKGTTILDKEYKYFKDNLNSLLQKYRGKFLIIKDRKVVGAYNSYQEALKSAIKQYKPGEFLIQECIELEKTTASFYNSYVVVNKV